MCEVPNLHSARVEYIAKTSHSEKRPVFSSTTISDTATSAGAVAESAAHKKRYKYRYLDSRYILVPVTAETAGS